VEAFIRNSLENLPIEEKSSLVRLFKHFEEALWSYIDDCADCDKTLPVMTLEDFAEKVFELAPWLLPGPWSPVDMSATYNAYKKSRPVCRAVIFNEHMTKVLLVKGWGGRLWGFPGGKVEPNETHAECVLREISEEIGYDANSDMLSCPTQVSDGHVTMFAIMGVPESTSFKPRCKNEIKEIAWHEVSVLSACKTAYKPDVEEALSHMEENRVIPPCRSRVPSRAGFGTTLQTTHAIVRKRNEPGNITYKYRVDSLEKVAIPLTRARLAQISDNKTGINGGSSTSSAGLSASSVSTSIEWSILEDFHRKSTPMEGFRAMNS
jgi:8-oxo-dGTP pyrophosphatase MutT (NUDIX family)